MADAAQHVKGDFCARQILLGTSQGALNQPRVMLRWMTWRAVPVPTHRLIGLQRKEARHLRQGVAANDHAVAPNVEPQRGIHAHQDVAAQVEFESEV